MPTADEKAAEANWAKSLGAMNDWAKSLGARNDHDAPAAMKEEYQARLASRTDVDAMGLPVEPIAEETSTVTPAHPPKVPGLDWHFWLDEE